MNRLGSATSPYLLQHAGNPVDWWPWGEEAFAEARRRDVPLLISVGYSACHWCHVMAHESFEDQETAALMNERFVSVKVDREERPDVDAVYMTATQAMTDIQAEAVVGIHLAKPSLPAPPLPWTPAEQAYVAAAEAWNGERAATPTSRRPSP